MFFAKRPARLSMATPVVAVNMFTHMYIYIFIFIYIYVDIDIRMYTAYSYR